MNSSNTIAAKEPAAAGMRAYGALGGYALILALLLLLIEYGHGITHDTGNRAAEVPLHPICAHWDGKAADAVARLLHETGDVSLRQAGDALFRLRRARRNCRAGWLALSCRDYHVIVRPQDHGSDQAPSSKTLCSPTTIE
jgi:hypothetical protein